MRRFIKGLTIVLTVLIFTSTSLTQQKKALSNTDIINMVKAGLPESTIILSIEKSESNFQTEPQNLIELKKQGVTTKVLESMINAGSVGGNESQPANKNSKSPVNNSPEEALIKDASTGNVWFVDGSKRTKLEASPIKGMKTGGLGKALIPVYGIFSKKKIKDRIQGGRAALRINQSTPQFEIRLTNLEIKPSESVAIVKFSEKSDEREVSVGEIGFLGSSSGVSDKNKMDISIEEVKTAQGTGKIYKITFLKPLEPGEYGLTLMPGYYYDFGIDKE